MNWKVAVTVFVGSKQKYKNVAQKLQQQTFILRNIAETAH